MRFASVCLLAACGSSSAPQPAPVAPASEPADHVLDGPGRASASGAASPVDASVVAAIDANPRRLRAPLVATGDLDGAPGEEEVTLAGDGTLTATLAAGTIQIAVELADNDPVFHDQFRLAIVSLGGKRRGIVVASPTGDGEDPPNRYRVFLHAHGTLRPVFDRVIGVYGVTPLVFAADGTASYTESGWMACTRVPGAARVAKQHVTLALDAKGTALRVTRRVDTTDVQPCDELSACPFVYRLGDGPPRLLGEILRNVRGRDAATVQALAVGGQGAGRITLQLAEAKPEVTYLDAIYLEVDGARIAPRACGDLPAAPYCEADGRHHVLREGDTLELAFDTPAHAASRLVARGYYVPTPTAATR